MQLKAVNQSLLKAFVCPRRGKLTVEQGSSSGPAARIGRAIHEFAKALRDDCMKRNVSFPSDGTVSKLADKAARKHALSADETEDMRDIVERFASDWSCSVYDDYEAERTLHCSSDWEPCEVEDAAWFGTPDLVRFEGKEATLIDFKSSRQIPSESEAAADIQLKFYASLVLVHRPEIEIFHLRYQYVRYNWSNIFRMTKGDILSFREELEGMRGTIEGMTDHPPVPGSACGFCGFAADCPKVREAFPVMVTSPENASEAAGRLRAMRKAVSDYEQALKAWAEVHGEIEVGDEVLGYGSKERLKFKDPAEVYYRLGKIGIDPHQAFGAFSTSKTAIVSLMRKTGNKDAIEDVLQAGEIAQTTEFRFRKNMS